MANRELVGNERGEVMIRFSTEALKSFLDGFNEAHVVKDGYRITLSVDEYTPGEAVLLSTLDWED